MKVLFPNSVCEISADSEDSSYPVSNLEDSYPKNIWRSNASNTGVLTISSNRGGNSVTLFNTNAETVDVSVIPYADDTTDIVINGTFDDWTGSNPDSWSKDVNITLLEDTGRGGSGSSVKMTATSSSTKQFYQTETVVAEKWHVFKFYYKNTAGDTMDYFVYDVTNAGYIITEITLDDSTSWSGEQIISFKTPASCVSVKIGFTPTNDTDIVWVDDVTLVQEVETNSHSLISGGVQYSQLWADFDNYQPSSYTVILDMIADIGDVLKCGVIESGLANSFSDLRYGLTENSKDYSVVNKYKYGGVYINKRDIVRVYNGVLDVKRNSDFLTFMKTIVKENQSNPLSIYLINTLPATQWVLYGRFVSMPNANFAIHSDNELNMTIEEVV